MGGTMKIEVDIDKISQLVKKSTDIFLSPEGENELVELYKLQEMIEKAIHDAKANLAKKALKLDPDFRSIQGDKVKVAYRAYGSRYRIDLSLLQQLPGNFYKSKTTYSPIPSEVDQFVNEHGTPPMGIIENTREKQLQVTIKKGGRGV
jgi:hypothetical protein